MGKYTGRTQKGKVFAVLRQYFEGVPVGTIFRTNQLCDALLETYNRLFPNNPVTDKTGVYDGLRCLVNIENSPIKRIDRGKYKFVRHFEDKDSSVFNRNYYKAASKGGAYKELKKKQGEKSMSKGNKKDNTSSLTQLGSAETKYEYNNPSPELLEVFENQYPNRDYLTEFVFTEFSSLCPKTGQPDFATIKVQYVPDKECIETKSLKLYFLAFRQYGSFMETITNKVLEDCVSVCRPRWMKIVANFNARGGTLINVEAEYEAD